MLEFQHVTFQYDSEDFNIIDDLSFTVEPEEFISILPAICPRRICSFHGAPLRRIYAFPWKLPKFLSQNRHSVFLIF